MSHRLHRMPGFCGSRYWRLLVCQLAYPSPRRKRKIIRSFTRSGPAASVQLDAAEDLTVLHEFSGSPKDGVPWASWITPAYGLAPSCPPLKRQSSRPYINVSIS